MKVFILFLSLIFSSISFSQHVTNLNDLEMKEDFENIRVKQLDTDTNSTTFIIWVHKGVKSHKHNNHSELIYVIEGEGNMTVNESQFYIGPGDYFRIPENTFHSLDVLSKKPMKVLSVQAPKFDGTDRIVDENDTMIYTKDKNKEVDFKK